MIEPELIIKVTTTTVSDSDRGDMRIPLVLLLGNSEGFRWLSKYFSDLSERADELQREQVPIPESHPDPDDHSHLSTSESPFNQIFCDDMEFRFGMLTKHNRSPTLAKYGIEQSRDAQ